MGERKQRRSWQAWGGGPGHKQVWDSGTPREEVRVLPGPSAGPGQVGRPLGCLGMEQVGPRPAGSVFASPPPGAPIVY